MKDCPKLSSAPSAGANANPTSTQGGASTDGKIDRKKLVALIATELGYNFTGVLASFEMPPRALPDDFYQQSITPSSEAELSDPGVEGDALEGSQKEVGLSSDQGTLSAENPPKVAMAPLIQTSDEYLLSHSDCAPKRCLFWVRLGYRIGRFGGLRTLVHVEI